MCSDPPGKCDSHAPGLIHIVGLSNTRLLYPANHEDQKLGESKIELPLHILDVLPACIFGLYIESPLISAREPS